MTDKCVHCGAVLDGPVTIPMVCAFCKAPQPLPALAEGQIHLTDDGVLGLLRQRLSGVESTFLHPSIPARKMTSVRKVHAVHLPADEHVIGIYDGTAFGSATEGFVVTSKRLCYKNTLESAGVVEWKDIDPHEVYAEDVDVCVGRLRLMTLFGPDDDGLYEWADVIATLARSARPMERISGMPGAAPLRSSSLRSSSLRSSSLPPPGSGWGGADVAVQGGVGWGGTSGESITGGVPLGAPRPEVERFQVKPYRADAAGVSIVDVHPSGEIVLVASSAGVELRYAQNGALYLALDARDGVLDARFSPDGNWLLTGDMRGRAQLFNVRSGAAQGATQEASDYCDQVVWLGGSERFAFGTQRGEVALVDARTMQVTHTLLGPDPDHRHLGGLVASQDGRRLYVSLGERLGCFDTETARIVWRNDHALQNAARLTVTPASDRLIAAGYDGLAIFDPATGTLRAQCDFPCAHNVTWPEVYEDEGMFRTKKVTEEATLSWTPHPCVSPAGDLCAVQDHVGNLDFLDLSAMTLHPTAREHGRAFIEDLAWFPDGNHLLLGMSDDSIAVWSVRPLAGVMRAEVWRG